MFYFKCPGLKGSVRLGKKSLGSPALLSASTPPLWQDTKGRLHGTKCLPLPSWTHIQAPSVQFHLRRISLTVGVKTPRTTQMVQSFLSPGLGILCKRKRKNEGNSIPLQQQFAKWGP